MSKWSRNFTANVRDRDVSMLLDLIIARLRTVNNVSTAEAVGIILRVGAEQLKERPEFESDGLGKYELLTEKYRAAQERIELRAMLSLIYDQFGLDGLTDLESTLEMSTAEMIELIDRQVRKGHVSRFSVYKQFITDALSDGEPHAMSEIVQEAIVQSILPNRASDNWGNEYQLFKVAANRLGATGGKRGMWQLVK